MKTRVLIILLALAVVAFAYQAFQFTQLAQQAQNPLGPSQRFATPLDAPTEEEIAREEQRLAEKVQRDRVAAAAAASKRSK